MKSSETVGSASVTRASQRAAERRRAMNNTVRTSLETLQGLLDEGYITQAEFKQRRSAILDKVTSVHPNAKSSVFSRLGGGESSVFSRLGGGEEATGRTGSGSSSGGKWTHDGYAELYGGGKKANVKKPGAAGKKLAGAISKGGKTAAKHGDLRSMLSGAGKSKQPTKHLPTKCPW